MGKPQPRSILEESKDRSNTAAMSAKPALESESLFSQLQLRSTAVSKALIEAWQEFSLDHFACLSAIGGFGRAELFAHSDIDLLILTDADLSPEQRAAIGAFEATAWQLKLDLAISVRSVAQSAAFAAEDLNFMTSVLDVRYLSGKRVLLQELLDCLSPSKLWAPADFFAAKVAEQEARHHRFQDTAYNNEPNLKEGPGALRDWHSIRWIAQRHFYAQNLLANDQGRVFKALDLERFGCLNATERLELEHAEQVLGSYRQALHELAKRKEERLLFDHQINLAENFGLVDQGFNNRAVEQLMQRYFRAVADLLRINASVIAYFASIYYSPEPQLLATPDVRAAVVLRGGLLDLLDSKQSLSTVECFHLLAYWQQVEDCQSLGWCAQRAIGDAFLQAQVPGAADFSAFLKLLDAPARVAGALHLAAKHRLLGWLIPAFDRVSGRMQYDLFHAYTVDQHTLFVLDKLERSRTHESAAELPLAYEVWARIQKPRLLFLAALFHDIAKGRGGDHSVLGADDVREFGAAASISETDTDLIAWLVHEHLTMSTIAQKRDIQDAAVVGEFAAKVSDRERLDHLYLLTVADIRGTNPKLWNGWKDKLLADLYASTRFLLRRGLEHPVHAKERVSARQAEALELLRSQGAGLDAVQSIWADFPEHVFLRYSAEELRFQTQAILQGERAANDSQRSIKQKPTLSVSVIVVRPVPGTNALELFVRIHDRAGIFATIATVLDRLGINVLGARIGLCASQMTHDTFQLIESAADAKLDIGSLRERAMEIQIALGVAFESMTLHPKVSKKLATRQQKHFQFAAQIEITPDADPKRSVLSITCADAPGLLAKMSVCLFEQNLRLHSARIATFGERVEDFFVISSNCDQALNHAEAEQLKAAMALALV